MKFQSNAIFNGTITANSVADAGTNTDKFLVLTSGGLVNYRTAAELYADLGIGTLPAGYTSTLKHQVKAGVALTKGQAVYVTSADGTNMIVGKASNGAESTSSKTLGLIETSLSINGIGNVITEGLLAGLDTTGANAAGDPVWLGTNGDLIYGLANKPYAPAHLVFIGIVTRINANNGEIFVKVQNGFELDELHNIDLKTTAPINGDILGYNGTLWVNKTIAGWLGFTPADDSLVVHLSGTETISGFKYFDAQARFNFGIALKSPAGPYQSISGLNGGIAITVGSASQSLLFSTSTNYNYTFPNSDGTIALLSDIPTLSGLGGVPTSRTITINGTTYDLSANRSWSVTSMVYPAAGIAVSTGTAWGTSITDNSSNWNTAYGWGNHASAGYVPGARTITINGTSYDLTADRSWTVSTSASARNIQKFTATANQTTFTITGGYTPGLVDVFQNGVKLDNSGDFTATDGSVVTLATGAAANDIIEVYKYITAFTANNSLRQITAFTATAGQTSFTVTYSPGYVDVFYNGSKLAASEFTATSGSAIVLATACFANDIVEVIAYNYAVGAFTGIGGSGTANYIPKFTASGTIANSTIYDNGNIGIGTTNYFDGSGYGSTARYLTILNSSASSQIEISTNSTTNDSLVGGFDFINAANAGTSGSGRYGVAYVRGWIANASGTGNTSGGYMTFGTKADGGSQSERMRITSAGVIGIGTSSPRLAGSGYSGIEISSTTNGASILLSNSTNNITYIYTSNSGGDFLIENAGAQIFRAGSAEKMRITSGGALCVNMTSSAYGIVAIKSNNTTAYMGLNVYANGNGNFTYMNHNNNVGIIGTEFGVSGTGHTDLTFQSGGTEKFRIGTGGDVGAMTAVTGQGGALGQYKNFYWGAAVIMARDAYDSYYCGNVYYDGSWRIKYGGQSGNVVNWYNGDYSFLSTTSAPSSNSVVSLQSNLYLTGAGNMTIRGSLTQNGNPSDINLKENLVKISSPLEKISQINGYNFDWKEGTPMNNLVIPVADGMQSPESPLSVVHDAGLIAQEVEAIMPELVRENGHKSLNYNGIIALLVESVKELKAEIEQLKAK